MNQSSVIFGTIILAFFVYITRKGELPIYAGLLLLSPGTSSAPTGDIYKGAIAALGLL
jgi:hypothetical protein